MTRFANVMAERTDVDLVAIAAGTEDDYDRDAIDAAKRELEKRGLAAPELLLVKAKVRERLARANEPLETTSAAICFFVSMLGMLPGLLFLAWSGDLAQKGYTRKAHEQRKYAALGMGTFVALLVAFALLGTCVNR